MAQPIQRDFGARTRLFRPCRGADLTVRRRIARAGSDGGNQETIALQSAGEANSNTHVEPPGLGSVAPLSMEDVFERMASLCKQAGNESLSGPGSSLEHTGEIRRCLSPLLERLGVKNIVDAPCGDFNWMRVINLDVDEYIGVDILSGVIAQNEKSHALPNRKFLCLDLTKDVVPKTDLILCRDFLVHLSYDHIFQALRNFKRSRSTYLLTTTFPEHRLNNDIVTGDWRPLNLQCPPFNFPPPLQAITEKCREQTGRYFDKSLGLWKLMVFNR